MKLSVVIPAFNEEKVLPDCLASIKKVTGAVAGTWPGMEFEVVVTDNNSTDATARLAQAAGATVVFEPENQIAKARNVGAAAASGDWLLFIDADSVLHEKSLRDLLETIQSGRAVGGGSLIALDTRRRLIKAAVRFWNLLARLTKWAAGSFVFCRADAFRELGGFSEELYASEEIDFSRRLKQWGKPRGLKFVLLTRQPHVSSARKIELYSTWEVLRQLGTLLFHPHSTVRNRSKLRIFYDGRR